MATLLQLYHAFPVLDVISRTPLAFDDALVVEDFLIALAPFREVVMAREDNFFQTIGHKYRRADNGVVEIPPGSPEIAVILQCMTEALGPEEFQPPLLRASCLQSIYLSAIDLRALKFLLTTD